MKYAEEDAKIEAERMAADKLAHPEKYKEGIEEPVKPEIELNLSDWSSSLSSLSEDDVIDFLTKN